MKNLFITKWLIFALAISAVVLFASCQPEEVNPTPIFIVNGNGHSSFNQHALQNELNNLPKEPISVEEEASLRFMREEEKLARDVYVKLYEKWGRQIFDNISESESTHMQAVLLLLNKYELSDPVGTNGIGVFVDTTFQRLYNDLTARGLQTETEALKVGAIIEEIDILDLDAQLSDIVDNQDIIMVYENLGKGSRNHLRAFIKNLNNLGINYIPEYLSQEYFDEIIQGDMERGG